MSIDDLINNATEADDVEVGTFARMLAVMTYENIEKIDELISEFSINWKIQRIPKVPLSVLRLAICEMLFIDSIPQSVSINEAVELTKTYASSDDASYVNGILASVHKKLNG